MRARLCVTVWAEEAGGQFLIRFMVIPRGFERKVSVCWAAAAAAALAIQQSRHNLCDPQCFTVRVRPEREAYLPLPLLNKRALAHLLTFFFTPCLFKSSRIGFSHLCRIFTSTCETFSSSYQTHLLLPPDIFSNPVINLFLRPLLSSVNT